MELSRFSRIFSNQQRSARLSLYGLILALMLSGPSSAADQTGAEPLAEVNGETITAKDLEGALGARLSKLEEQIYDLKQRELDSLIAQRLFAQEAAKRGISVAALLDAEVTGKVSLVTEKEIEDFYQANKARMRGDETEIRQKIRAFLQQQKLTARREAFVESLRSQGKVIVRLQPPATIRVEVSTDGAPIRGAADAPVTVVEFSDFECPFCKQTHPTLKQLLERYPGKVRLAYRDFPLDSIHPQTRRAALKTRESFGNITTCFLPSLPNWLPKICGVTRDKSGLMSQSSTVVLQRVPTKPRCSGTWMRVTAWGLPAHRLSSLTDER